MQVIKIPKLLQSLSALSLYKIGTHIDLDVDRQRIKVRHWSRRCLWYFQYKGDEQVQSELVNLEYGRAMSIVISTAGGKGEERGEEIFQGVNFISRFLRELHIGRNNYRQPSFQPLTLLARRTQEHLVEEGAIEEIEAQMKTYSHFQREANEAKAATLNRFIHNN
ncbi:MAG: hypothetical protein EZS28_004484 [Streblomastix strix]|uniref:Uncharacterized protein n=1 Tax=Streblomastix strix TaxID=222440 RepID=A0A5J4WY30_9EUKA|nr:MAG: hypothetical protein EZS28_004484 [Streblomastix strix]